MSSYYITTPIYYVNDEPHIGHAYSTILADIISRYKRLEGADVFFLTGNDEHGQKVQDSATKRGVSPQEHVDEYVKRFQEVWEKLNISHTDFIRTTEKRHTKQVQSMLQKLFDSNDIYFDEYTGLYSVSEERYITQTEAADGNFRDIKELKESNYFFRMSSYQDRLIDHIKQNDDFIEPKSRRNEILKFLEKPLNDLCITRPKKRLSWGIETPFDSDYVTYVWFDALLNYITAIGWNSEEKKFNNYWPANIHIMAKDILVTHSVYWPCMLLAAGIKLPKKIFAHGWWMFDDAKMSKSLGNVVKPLDLADRFGSDALRYYLMRDMVLGMDASFSYDNFINRYNSDLANDFGNLVNRITMLIKKYFNNIIPNHNEFNEDDLALISKSKSLSIEVINLINDMKIHDAIEKNMSHIRSINKYLEIKSPWKRIKDEDGLQDVQTTMFVASNALFIATQLIEPVIPKSASKVYNIFSKNPVSLKDISFGQIQCGEIIKDSIVLFPRIEI